MLSDSEKHRAARSISSNRPRSSFATQSPHYTFLPHDVIPHVNANLIFPFHFLVFLSLRRRRCKFLVGFIANVLLSFAVAGVAFSLHSSPPRLLYRSKESSCYSTVDLLIYLDARFLLFASINWRHEASSAPWASRSMNASLDSTLAPPRPIAAFSVSDCWSWGKDNLLL